MNERVLALDERLRRLRTEFDRTFASPRARSARGQVRLLSFGIGEAQLAFRAEEIAGIQRSCRIVRAPGAVESCLGFTGVHGKLVAVFSLARLLGLSRSEDEGRWTVLSAAEPSVGLAFERFQRFHEVDAERLHPVREQESRGNHVREIYQGTEQVQSVLDVISIVSCIRSVAGSLPQEGAS